MWIFHTDCNVSFLFVLICVGLAFLFLVPIFWWISKNECKEYVRLPIEFTVLFLCALCAKNYMQTHKVKSNKKIQTEEEQWRKLESMIRNDTKNGYKIYIDGSEVEYDNVDLSAYNIKINTETKKIILSRG